jgi:hypothetical protein
MQNDFCGKLKSFHIYVGEDGIVSCAVNQVWIAGLWTGAEECLSWRDDWDAAEIAFRENGKKPLSFKQEAGEHSAQEPKP